MSKLKNEENGIELPPGETIIIQQKASYKKSWMKYVGGSFTVTNEKVYFRPQTANVSRKTVELLLKNIHVLRKAKTLGVLSNRILLGDSQGEEYVFVVRKRNQVIEAIENQLQQK